VLSGRQFQCADYASSVNASAVAVVSWQNCIKLVLSIGQA
jgi:hypothetical protein